MFDVYALLRNYIKMFVLLIPTPKKLNVLKRNYPIQESVIEPNQQQMFAGS